MPVDRATVDSAVAAYRRGEIPIGVLKAMRDEMRKQKEPASQGGLGKDFAQAARDVLMLTNLDRDKSLGAQLGERIHEQGLGKTLADVGKGAVTGLARGAINLVDLADPVKRMGVIEGLKDRPFTGALEMVGVAGLAAGGGMLLKRGLRGAVAAETGALGSVAKTGVATADKPHIRIPTSEVPFTTVGDVAIKPGVAGAPPKLPELLPLTKSENKALRAAYRFEELPAVKAQSWREAKAAGFEDKAIDIAGEVKLKPRTVSAQEFAGMELKTAKLLNEATDAHDIWASAVAKGDDASAAFAKARYESLMENVDLISEAVDLSGTEAGRALAIRNAAINMKTYDIQSVVKQATVAKGSALTPEEFTQLREMVAKRGAEKDPVRRRMAAHTIDSAIEAFRPMTAGTITEEAINTLRTAKTVADVSSLLRQNLVLSVTRPVKAAKAFGGGLRAMFSRYGDEQIDMAMRSAPTQAFRERAKLWLPEPGAARIGAREEYFESNWLRHIPGVKYVVEGSERFFRTNTNLLRSSAFDEILKVPSLSVEQHRGWADFINKASGRGDLGQLGQSGRLLAKVFFAPRFMASRFQTPAAIIKYRKMPVVRKMIAKDLGATVGVGVTALYLLNLNEDVEVSTDPRSSDWGRVRIGDTRFDIWAGFQPVARLVVREGLIAGQGLGVTPASLKSKNDAFGIAGQFLKYKFSPALTAPYELITGKGIVGGRKSRGAAVRDAFVPMIGTDIMEAYKLDSPEMAAAAGVASAVGLGVNTYER